MGGEALARSSAGYVGAELEQAVIDAMYVAFNDGPRDVTDEDIRNAVIRMVPLSRSQRERVETLRAWLQEGTCAIGVIHREAPSRVSLGTP